MIEIIFEAHATSRDNEAGLASGWNDIDLSSAGITQAEELGRRYEHQLPDAVFCSDLQRSYKTGAIAFKGTFVPIVVDERLRECNYGNLTQSPKEQVEPNRADYIDKPFPNGESYIQTAERMKSFLSDLLRNYDTKRVMIIGHRATQYGLEHWVNEVPLLEIATATWKWQPGWKYELREFN